MKSFIFGLAELSYKASTRDGNRNLLCAYYKYKAALKTLLYIISAFLFNYKEEKLKFPVFS